MSVRLATATVHFEFCDHVATAMGRDKGEKYLCGSSQQPAVENVKSLPPHGTTTLAECMFPNSLLLSPRKAARIRMTSEAKSPGKPGVERPPKR